MSNFEPIPSSDDYPDVFPKPIRDGGHSVNPVAQPPRIPDGIDPAEFNSGKSSAMEALEEWEPDDIVTLTKTALALMGDPVGPARETDATIARWAVATFGPGDKTAPRMALRVLEEALELAYECGASPGEVDTLVVKMTNKSLELYLPGGGGFAGGEKSTGYEHPHYHVRVPEAARLEIGPEAADVRITLAALAGTYAIDMDGEVNRKMIVNRARKWSRHGDGTGQHIRD